MLVYCGCDGHHARVNAPSSPPNNLPALIIGYGSTLRGDDGVGPRVVELLQTAGLPGVETIPCHQLTPELADPISRSRMVIFVDAAVDVPDGLVRVEPVSPMPAHQVMVHTVSPQTLLHLAKSVFGHCPPAWTVAIPVAAMDIGEQLSPLADSGAQTACQRIIELLRANPDDSHLA